MVANSGGWIRNDAGKAAPLFVLACFVAALLPGCYSLRPSSGGGQAQFDGTRRINPDDIALPDGYRIELVAQKLTFPTGACFDNQGRLHVVESGYCY